MAKKETESSYENFENLVDLKKIPILPLDNRWHQLFPDNLKTPRIKKLEKEVMNLVKRESGVSREIKSLVGLKKKLMKEIVDNMEETDDENEKLRQKKLDASRKLIEDINNKNTELENEKYQLPYRLMKVNEELLMESIENCYSRLSNNEMQIEALGEWIDKTRIQLKRNVVIKQDKTDENNSIYGYMHDMLGHEVMEIFDREHNYDKNKFKEEK
ncbi:MAG: hypothetical protein SPL51_03205 [Lachnospiraceae bacterium]|nr:hypothetical protein [Lachnospiraceae bacterium]